jgi:hypothetical protein
MFDNIVFFGISLLAIHLRWFTFDKLKKSVAKLRIFHQTSKYLVEKTCAHGIIMTAMGTGTWGMRDKFKFYQ